MVEMRDLREDWLVEERFSQLWHRHEQSEDVSSSPPATPLPLCRGRWWGAPRVVQITTRVCRQATAHASPPRHWQRFRGPLEENGTKEFPVFFCTKRQVLEKREKQVTWPASFDSKMSAIATQSCPMPLTEYNHENHFSSFSQAVGDTGRFV